MIIFDDLLNHKINTESAVSSEYVLKHVEDYRKKFQESRLAGRAPKMWIQYIEMLDIHKRFIKAGYW